MDPRIIAMMQQASKRGMGPRQPGSLPPGSVVVACGRTAAGNSAAHDAWGSPAGMYGNAQIDPSNPMSAGCPAVGMAGQSERGGTPPNRSTRAGPRRIQSAAIAHADAGRWRDGG